MSSPVVSPGASSLDVARPEARRAHIEQPRVLRNPRTWWSNRAPVMVALAFAAAFLALRLAYRVVFGGFPESASGWVSVGGGVARSSLPFVTVVLVFGALNTVLDVRLALTRGLNRGVLRRLRTALVVSLAALPALLDSVRVVRETRRLRGDRSLSSILVPVLERSLERGVTLGASLEQRGLGMGRDGVHGMCDAPVVARGLTLGFTLEWSLDVGDLIVDHGTCLLVTGDTASGKTALLHALSGRIPHSGGGWLNGILEVGGFDRRGTTPSETARFVSIVEQNVRDAFVTSRVFDEIAFSLRMMRQHERDIARDVHDIASRVGIADVLGRDIHALSAGEATLVALAAALVTKPSLLLLDEPIADLDDVNARRVIAVLATLAHDTGVTMIIAEHRWAELEPIADRRVHLRSSDRLEAGIPGEQTAEVGLDVDDDTDESRDGDGDGDARSCVTALVAPNGAGKTTWMRAFASANSAHVRLVPESPELLFSRSTVRDECARNDRLAKLAPDTTLRLARELLVDVPLDAHPRDLSTGQRVALACALQAATGPDLLLLDEPTRGLDAAARARLRRMLRRLAATGTSVIFATHDLEFAAQFSATRRAVTP